jgi:hypothetical protein
MKGDQVFDSPFVAYDHSELSLKMLTIVDNLKHLLPKLTILHVHNPSKLYLQQNNRGDAIYK